MDAKRPPRLLLEILVFTSGAVGMILELAGSRLLAPYFGNSLFVWTSLIGVMLGFMSLGYYLGGKLADRRLDRSLLFWILLVAAVCIGLVSFSERSFLPGLVENGATATLSVVAAVILFAVPSTMLGMVSPYAIRLKMHHIEDSGSTVGTLYAISTVGSIVGTFAAGFWLIARFGTHDVIVLLVGVLIAMSLPFIGRITWYKPLGVALALALAVSSFLSTSEGGTFDTRYDRYFLSQSYDAEANRPIIGLSRDDLQVESAVYADDLEPVSFPYYRYFDLASTLTPKVERALVIGGGTFSYPRLFLNKNPRSKMDVVEIDPDLVDIARERFGYTDDPRMRVHVEDGRTFLNRVRDEYDVIYIDAFKSLSSIPYQLTTRESIRRCYQLLDDDGVLVMNTITSVEGEKSKLLAALVATAETEFPQVEVFLVQQPGDPKLVQNVSIVAVKDPSLDFRSTVKAKAGDVLENLQQDYRPAEAVPAMTDDFAPVDQYLMGL